MAETEKDRLRGTGGNRFIPADATRADLHEEPWSVTSDARDEAKSARRDERGHYRAVGDEMVDESRVPERGGE